MLSPDVRTMLTTALKPPSGTVFDTAVATTYTLDPILAMMLPVLFSGGTTSGDVTDENDAIRQLQRMRAHAGKITVFVQTGGIKIPRIMKPSPVFSLLEPVLHQTTSPRGGIFHPKVVLVRYKGEYDTTYYRLRLIVMTRNLTFDKSWDLAVILDGEVIRKYRTDKNDVLRNFIRSLAANSSLQSVRRKYIEELLADLTHVDWNKPEGFTQVDFHDLAGRDIDWIPDGDIERWGVISPFLKKEALDVLSMEPLPPSFILSREEEIAKVGCVENGMVLKDISELTEGDESVAPIQVSGLHAKCYMYDYVKRGCRYTRVVIGSANATASALGKSERRNTEFMVSLSGRRTANGINDFIKSMEPYWMPYSVGDKDDVDSENEKAKKLLENCKRALVDVNFKIDCVKTKNDLYSMTLSTSNGRVISPYDGISEIKVYAITQTSATAVMLGLPGKCWQMPPLRAESVTGLIAFEITSEMPGLVESFVLNLPVHGIPPNRNDMILASMISNSDAFFRFLAMLLEDGASSESTATANLVRTLLIKMNPSVKSLGSADVPLADSLLKAYCRNPSVLSEIAAAVTAAERSGDDLLPKSFKKLWAGFAPLAKGSR